MIPQNKVYNKEDLIKLTSDSSGYDINVVRSIMHKLEENVLDIFTKVNPDTSVSVKLFQGINFDGIYVPEKQKRNNLTGIIENVPERIKIKSNITRNYLERVNSIANYN